VATQSAPRSGAAQAREPITPMAEPAAAAATPAIAIARFEDLIALAIEKRDLVVKTALERDMRLVRFEDGTLEVALEPGAARTMIGELSRKLSLWTGRRWMVAVSAEEGAPTIKAQAEARKAELLRGVAADPLVQAVLNRFPGAEIVDVRGPAGAGAPLSSGTSDEPSEEIANDDGVGPDEIED
jgi:DNA polymerase-3 subunit gamma/tau